MGLSISSVMPTIAVDDLDRAIRFYSDTLGLSVRRLEGEMRQPRSSRSATRTGCSSTRARYKRGETTYASFLCEDVEGTVRELRDKGVTFEEYDFPGLKTVNGIATTGELKTAWFRDSEGNTLAISNEVAEVMRKAA